MSGFQAAEYHSNITKFHAKRIWNFSNAGADYLETMPGTMFAKESSRQDLYHRKRSAKWTWRI
jgi:hypothetical protein